MFDPLLSVFKHREEGQELRLVKEFAQLVDGVVVIEEINSVVRAVLGVRPLYLHEQVAELLFEFLRHDRRFDAQFVLDEGDMFVIFVVTKLLQNFLGLSVCDLSGVDSLFFNLLSDVLQDSVRDLCSLFGLELGEYLPEMIDPFVGVETDLFWGFLIRWFLSLN